MFATLARLDRRFTTCRAGKMLLVLSLVAMIFADFYVHAAHACLADRNNDISAHDAIDRTGFSYGTAGIHADPAGENERSALNEVFCDAAHCVVFVAPMVAAVLAPLKRAAKPTLSGLNISSLPPALLERPPRASA